MSWFLVIAAGLFEMIGVIGINKLNERISVKNVGITVVGFGLSFVLLTLSLEELPMGTAYAIWTGIGVVGGAIVGMVFYNEGRDWKRIVFIAMILSATIGLKLIS